MVLACKGNHNVKNSLACQHVKLRNYSTNIGEIVWFFTTKEYTLQMEKKSKQPPIYEVLNSSAVPRLPGQSAIHRQPRPNSPAQLGLVGPGRQVPTYYVIICISHFFQNSETTVLSISSILCYIYKYSLFTTLFNSKKRQKKVLKSRFFSCLPYIPTWSSRPRSCPLLRCSRPSPARYTGSPPLPDCPYGWTPASRQCLLFVISTIWSLRLSTGSDTFYYRSRYRCRHWRVLRWSIVPCF